MNEAARLQILDAIGIMPLVPRFVLPGAKPSPQGEVVQLENLPLATQPVVQVPPKVFDSPQAATQVERPSATKSAPSARIDIDIPDAAARREPIASGAAENGAAAEQVRLQVCLCQHHPRLFSLLPLYRADFQQEADQFIAAVAKSVGVQPQAAAPQVFRWPYVNNPKLDHGINALRETLAAFVKQSAREPGCVLLLWGADLSRYLPVPAITAPGEFALGENLRVIAVRRVQDYFNEPQLKRELWQQISALKPAFHGQ